MKVNTDGVLLGAVMEILPGDHHCLDIGTGTGTIALMAAQRLSAHHDNFSITAIDIDKDSADEASENFARSPWKANLTAVNTSLEEFTGDNRTYSLIFSNPPYFDRTLEAQEFRRNNARHISGLSYREILEFASGHIEAEGRVAFILPHDNEADLLRYGRMCGFFPKTITRIRTVPRKLPSRIIVEFTQDKTVPTTDRTVTIQDHGEYTEEYLGLMRDFYLFA